MYDGKLDTFIAVVEAGSFSKAATKLFISPVSVMKQIEALENDTQIKLFNRSTQGVVLTSAGESVYESARKLIHDANLAIENAQKIATNEKPTIRIGTSLLRSSRVLTNLWTDFNEGPLPFNLKIVPFGDDPTSMQRMFTSLGETVDCFVGPTDSYQLNDGHYKVRQLTNVSCCCAVPKLHRLANKEGLTWADLDGESLLLVRRGQSPVLDRMRDEIEAEHTGIKIVDTENFYDIDAFNLADQRQYIMETLEIWKNLHPSLVTIPMKWDFKMPYGIIYSDDASDAVHNFINLSEKLYKNNVK